MSPGVLSSWVIGLSLLAGQGIAFAQPRSLADTEAEQRAGTPYKAAEIMSLSPAKLVEVLNDGEASTFAKAKACQRLAVVGDERAVEALAALLSSPELSHYARFALEPLPGPQADAALRNALGKLKGDLLVGVINSIGRRKDTRALDALAKLRYDDDASAASAAEAALARIRSP